MKICLINNLYEPFYRGGAEVVVKKIFKELSGSDDVFLISTKPFFRKGKSKRGDRVYRINSLYYDLSKIPLFFRFFWHVVDVFDVWVVVRVFFIFIKERPEMVISNNLKGLSYLLPLLFKMMKVKHVHVLHDVQLICPSGLMYYGEEARVNNFGVRIYSGINKFLFCFCSYVVSPSQWLLDFYRKNGFFKNSKKKVLPNPLNFSSMKEGEMERDDFVFLYVGQIEKHKGVSLLIESFLKFSKGREGVRLKIIGDGSLLRRVSKIAENSNIIECLGRLSSDRTKNEIREADCLVAPSLCYENSPTVIYEAISLGTLVISSNIAGGKEIVKEFGGLLFDLKEEGDLIKVMKRALVNDFDKGRKDFNLKDFLTKRYIKSIKMLVK